MPIIESLNNRVENSFVGRFFELKERGSSFTQEFRGATATFLTMAYIIAVNPRILSDSGGPCVPCAENEGGIFCEEYETCMLDIQREFVTSTAIASMVGCFLMGIMANMPIALAPGMGMNAYFTYSVVGWRGTGDISYEAATTAVMIEGAIFFVLAITGIRYAIIKWVPEPVKTATSAGIGAFLAHLGLQTAEGIGIVVSDIATAVTLGACPEENRTPIVAFTDACAADSMACVTSDAYTCDDLGGIMTSGTAWLGILGLMIMAIMLAYKNKWAFFCGIGLITVVSWPRGTSVTYFPDTEEGDARFEYFKQVVSIEPIDKLLVPFTNELGEVGVALITFLYVDFLDTSGTLLALASTMGFADEHGDFPKSRWAFAADALSTMFGSLFGLSPVTSYIESGSGVEAGSKTGLTAVFCGFFFFLSIFFAPIISSIPPWATGGALVLVGCLMCSSLAKVKWYIPSHALSAFLTFIIMPLTYSIAYGLIAGICAYIIMEGTFWILSKVGIAKPEFTPESMEIVAPGQEQEEPEDDEAETPKKISDGGSSSEDVDQTELAKTEEDPSTRPSVAANIENVETDEEVA